MSYQVLARKWRPSNFNEVVGQQHVLQALVNALEQQRLHHAYLFSGTRGVGKTSIARLLAKCLNCEEGVSATPCGQCQSCQEIEQGRFVDLIEIDAASRTKVEDTREILDNVQYKPTRGRYKVYLIDEVHMLSRSSFNALLKTLEEPPEHVKFLFATTETQKLPVTILSRCLQFNLKALSPRQISGQLNHILTQEQVSFDEGALSLLSQSAKGSMRDALSLTDQAISHGNGDLVQSVVSDMLGTIDVDFSIELLKLSLSGNSQALFDLVMKISELAPDFDALLSQMIQNVHFASMAKLVPNSARLANQPRGIINLSEFDAELLQLFYSIMIQGRQELPWASDEQSGFEMILLRLLAFKPKDLNAAIDTNNTNKTDTNNNPDVPRPSTKSQSVPNHLRVNIESDDDKIVESLESEQASLLAQAQNQTNQKSPSGLSKVREALAKVDNKTVATETPVQLAATVTHPSTENDKPASNLLNDKPPVFEPLKEPNLELDKESENKGVAYAQESSPKTVNQSSLDSAVNEFTQEEMLNMSMAMAHEDDMVDYLPTEQSNGHPIEQGITINDVDVSKEHVVPANSDPIAQGSNTTTSDINAFLKAKNTLKNQRDDKVVDTVKKPLKVVEQTVSKQLPVNHPTIDQKLESLPVVNNNNLVQLTADIPVDLTKDEANPQALVEDPALLLLPNSDDPWTLKIEAMKLGGRLRQLAIHSTYLQQENRVTLLLSNEHAHLNAQAAVDALTKNLSLLLEKPIELIIDIGVSEEQTPYDIAQELHQHRLVLAGERIKQDEGVINFIQQFNATLVDESIKYRTIKAVK